MRAENDLRHVEHLMELAPVNAEIYNPSTMTTVEILWVLYDRILKYDPQRPRWEERDRFVLSKGHGPLGLYAILAHKQFFPAKELETFCAWDSMLGGHPDRNKVPGVEFSSGSLGHGLPFAVGIALALQAKQSRSRTVVLVGDGECNEGSAWEAILLAGNLKSRLSLLTCIVVNDHSSTRDLGDLAAKFACFGWAARTIDGRSQDQIYHALSAIDPDRPTAIVAEVKRTTP
jgi:transketolase